jgi:hypothetical protein
MLILMVSICRRSVMLAPLAIVALLIGGTQAAIVISDEEGARNQQPTVAQVETVKSVELPAE